jgi:hypothetical protein
VHWIKSYFYFSLPISSKTRSEIAKTKQVVTVKKAFLRLNNNLLEEKLNVRLCNSAEIFSKFRKFRCNVAKIVPKFRNFIGIQKFLHLCTKNIEICEFLRNYICIFANVCSLQPFSDEAMIYCDISTFKNTVVLANPILRHMNKSYI